MAMKEKFEKHTAGIRAEVMKIAELSDREGQYVWKKLTAEGGEFVGYAVSDDPSAYPDGGEQDGYWYEMLAGNSDIDCGVFTPSSNIKEIVIEHNLGVIPSEFQIATPVTLNANNRIMLVNNTNLLYITNASNRTVTNTGLSSDAVTLTEKTAKITIPSSSGIFFGAGIEHTWIVK